MPTDDRDPIVSVSRDLIKDAKLSRRSHRKSRNGCLNCKRRKVKCDEAKPTCANCIRFELVCERAAPKATRKTPENSTSDTVSLKITADGSRRGRGRPRKDWAAPPSRVDGTSSALPSSNSTTPSASDLVQAPAVLNVPNIELLLQYTSSTAQSLISFKPDCEMARYWTSTVPSVGLSHHYVLHFVLSSGGYHLARLNGADADKRRYYATLANSHFQAGLSEFMQILPNLDNSNYEALNLAAIFVCWCSFAAGPTSLGDLLVCNLDSGTPSPLPPPIHGVRLTHNRISQLKLSPHPVHPDHDPRPSPLEPSIPKEGLEWETPFRELREFITSGNTENTAVYIKSLDDMEAIYYSLFGKADGSHHPSLEFRFVFGWLYRMERNFIACVHRKEPLALIILAHYVVLLKTLRYWFMEGWGEHLVHSISQLLSEDVIHLLQWPRDQVLVDDQDGVSSHSED